MAPVSEPPPPLERDDARPVRLRRRWSIGGELGWNGLAGLGLNVSAHPIPALAIDTGLGLSAAGLKVGLRLRVNFLEGNWTPVIGAGMLYGLGSGGNSFDVNGQKGTATVEVKGSPFVQLVGGVNYTSDGGFTFLGTAGYAILLRKNTVYVSGSEETYDDVKALVGSGIVLSVAFGYAF